MRPLVSIRASRSSSSAEVSPGTLPGVLPPSLPGFDLDAACSRLGGNATLLAELLQTFAQEHSSCAADVEALLRESRPATAAAALHRMKSAARIIGAQALASAAESLERDIRHGRPVDTTEFSALLSGAVDNIGRHVISAPIARAGESNGLNAS
jgi:two-component system sensor histidine kinase/response regulator